MGQRLVPQLVARGYQVTATTTNPAKLGLLEQLGAEAVVMDGLDAASVGEAIAKARPDAIVHEMTAIGGKKPDMKHLDRWFATTNRLRTEGTDHLLAAADAIGRTQLRRAGLRKLERNPQGRVGEDRGGPAGPGRGARRRDEVTVAIRHLEDVVVKAGGAAHAIRRALRAGRHRRPGRARAQAQVPARRGRHRLQLVGARRRRGERHRPGCGAEGEGRVQHRRRRAGSGPANGCPTWLACAGAKPPMRVPKWLARLLAGEVAVTMMTEGRGFSNAKAKRELGWELRYPSWRQGFKEALVAEEQASRRGGRRREDRPQPCNHDGRLFAPEDGRERWMRLSRTTKQTFERSCSRSPTG